jgi:hypothetical protein
LSKAVGVAGSAAVSIGGGMYDILNWLAWQRIIHPGEYAIGVITAHPALVECRCDPIRVGNDNPPAANAEPHREGQ